MNSWNINANIIVNDLEDFVGEKIVTLFVMTAEAIRFQDVQNCINAVLEGGHDDPGLLWNGYLEELVKNWSQFFDRAIPVTCEMLQDLDDGVDKEVSKLKNYFGTFC